MRRQERPEDYTAHKPPTPTAALSDEPYPSWQIAVDDDNDSAEYSIANGDRVVVNVRDESGHVVMVRVTGAYEPTYYACELEDDDDAD